MSCRLWLLYSHDNVVYFIMINMAVVLAPAFVFAGSALLWLHLSGKGHWGEPATRAAKKQRRTYRKVTHGSN